MQELCPLCLKSGLKKKIKLLQINLQEAIWLCEEEKCAWPFGYENFVFCPRLVGKIWSCYWDNNVPPRLKENMLSSKPPLRNASMTFIKDKSTECISSILDTNPSQDINTITHNVNVIDTKYGNNDLHISVQEEPNIISQINNKKTHNVDNKTSSKSIDNPKLNDNNGQLDKRKIENIKNECENLLNKHIKEKSIKCAQNSKTTNNIRKIKKIEKSTIDISNVKTNDEVSMNQDKHKEISSINVYTNIEHNLSSPLTDTIQSITHSSENKELSYSESPKNDQLLNEATRTKSNLNVTMMKIDGLPPITLSFEIPVSTTVSETVTCNIEQNDCKTYAAGHMTDNNSKSNTLDTKNISTKRKITSGRLYEKFSFSAIKKKMETNNPINVRSNSNYTLNTKPTIKTEDIQNHSINNVKQENDCIDNFHDNQSSISSYKDCKQITSITNVNNDYILNQVNKYEPDLPSQEEISNSQETISDTTINSTANIENVLTDFLINDYSVSEDINDEWINSLLS